MECFTDSDENRYPRQDGEPIRIDWSRKYAAAVESSDRINARDLCRVWENWRESRSLAFILHGWLMLAPCRTYDEEWKEIDFLSEVLRAERDD